MKKIILGVLSIIIIVSMTTVFTIGGKTSSYIWCVFVFVIAPISAVLFVAQTITLIYRIFKKRAIKWNIFFLLITIIYMLPMSVIFGISPVVYPDLASENDMIEIEKPITDGIYLGGKSYKTHAYWPSERYAYDIVKEPYNMGSTNLIDYGIYGEEVLSPVNGTIIGFENNESDIEPNSSEFTSALGNYVFISIDESNTYMILAHFKENTITVSIGDKIEKGQLLGLVGNSGTSSEPHLHIQHQRENPLTVTFVPSAEGLPIKLK